MNFFNKTICLPHSTPKNYRYFKSLILASLLLSSFMGYGQIKVLIIDGQNNHKVWPKSTIMMKQYLEETGLFTVDIERTNYTWNAETESEYLPLAQAGVSEDLSKPKMDADFAPKFRKYDVIVSNFGWNAADWSDKTQCKFEKFIRKGGGFVSVHAADNSFPNWLEYNQMIGIGGWGDRDESHGPYVYYNNDGKLIRDNSPGKAGAHGHRLEIPITIREPNHPITKDMPLQWMTTKDECYAKLRGPAENMTVLATGKDQSANAPTDRHEPVLMTIDYGKGRVFHTTLGHDTESIESVGFIVSFTRGVEWAATGMVSQAIPKDFPSKKESKSRKYVLNKDIIKP
nr:ThuA domain-containing protein [Membranihabitans marinus]